jgi:DmsE family decaheme c-type cytochrome
MKIRLLTAMACLAWVVALPSVAGDDDSVAASAECLDCHEEINDDVLRYTAHATKFKVGCVDCHGTSATHIDDPDVGNISRAEGSSGMAACLSCHESDIHEHRPKRNQHSSSDVNCSDCHAIHASAHPPAPLLKQPQTDLCLSCHGEIRTYMRKPFTHKTHHGVVACSSCHDPHGGRGNAGFSNKRGEEATCVACHAEKRGPFVFEHVSGVTGTCTSCHEAHGSTNPKQLTRAHVSQLCLECHSTRPSGLLGSQPSAAHNLNSPRYAECTSCHVAIHGSSRSPLLLK